MPLCCMQAILIAVRFPFNKYVSLSILPGAEFPRVSKIVSRRKERQARCVRLPGIRVRSPIQLHVVAALEGCSFAERGDPAVF